MRAKRKPRRAIWATAAVLAAMLLGGSVVLLGHGIPPGTVKVQVSLTRQWSSVGLVATAETPETTTRVYERGFFAVVITRPRRR